LKLWVFRTLLWVVGISYVTLGCFEIDREKAIEYLQRALKIALDNNYLETAIWAYINLGNVEYADKGWGEEYYVKGYELAKKIGAIRYQFAFGMNMVNAYHGLGDNSKAKALGEESIAIHRKVGNLTELCSFMLWIAIWYQLWGELEKSDRAKAHKLLDEALEIFQKIGAKGGIERIIAKKKLLTA